MWPPVRPTCCSTPVLTCCSVLIREEIFRFVAGNARTWLRRITITREDTERVCPSVVFADRPLCGRWLANGPLRCDLPATATPVAIRPNMSAAAMLPSARRRSFPISYLRLSAALVRGSEVDPTGGTRDQRKLFGQIPQPERGAPKDVVLGHLDLFESEQVHHLREDHGAGDDRRRSRGVETLDLAALARASSTARRPFSASRSAAREHVAVNLRRVVRIEVLSDRGE